MIITLVVVLVAAGCLAAFLLRTSSSTNDADWIASANSYCRTTTDPELKAAEQFSSTAPDREALDYANANLQLDSFLRSSRPAALSAEVAEITNDWDQFANLLRQSVAANAAGDTASAQADITRGNSVNVAGNQVAQQIGLGDCVAAGGL